MTTMILKQMSFNNIQTTKNEIWNCHNFVILDSYFFLNLDLKSYFNLNYKIVRGVMIISLYTKT